MARRKPLDTFAVFLLGFVSVALFLSANPLGLLSLAGLAYYLLKLKNHKY